MSRYYKTRIEGELKEILDEIGKSRKAYFARVRSLAREFGAYPYEAYGRLEHGVLFALRFKTLPDLKLWKPWDKKGNRNAYAPRRNSKAGKAIAERFNDMPRVDYNPLWDHINWSKDQFRGNRVLFSPGYQWSRDKKWLLFCFDAEAKYTPIKGMEPITWEEYRMRGGEEA